MVTKRLIVLANSVKINGHCVAGREILAGAYGYQLGPWIRPVSSHGEGELYDTECQYGDGASLGVLDFADVSLTEPENNLFQPENWIIPGNRPWARPDTGYDLPKTLEETPGDLWFEEGNISDRMSHVKLTESPPKQSLYVVRPENFRLRLYTDSWDNRPKRKRRALFRYRGVDYDMSVTDPVITGRYHDQIPNYGKPAVELRLPCGDKLLICVSLAGDFKGNHYKLVATILENQQ